MKSYLFLPIFTLMCWMSLASAVDAAYRVEKIPGGDEVVGDFVVGPTKVELAIMPGSEKSLELLVTNRMGDRRQFNLEIEDAKGSTDPAQTVVLLGADRGPYSLRDYIYFDEASFVLEQGERARIPVTVRIPEDAPPGGLYGSVLVTTSSVAKEGDDALQSGAVAGSVIISRIGALFFVTVPGAVAREGALEKFTTVPSGKELFDLGPINFQVLFANTGSVHLNPSAVVSIKNMFGKEVASIEAEPWFALPQSVRMREITWPQKYLFGRYTADITLNRGYDNKTDTASVSFWVIPKMLVGGAFMVLTLIFFLLRFILRTFEIKKKR